MSIEADIVSGLKGYAGLSALVGNRIYSKTLPRNPTYPAIVYHRISSQFDQSMDRTLVASGPRFQFDVVSDNPSDQTKVLRELKKALIALSGATVTIYGLGLIDESTGNYDRRTRTYTSHIDIRVRYS